MTIRVNPCHPCSSVVSGGTYTDCPQIDVLVVENEEDVFTAMIALKDRQGAFADAVIGALGTRAGCSRTLTFDRRAARLPRFELA